MLMKDDKKKAATLIVSSLSPKVQKAPEKDGAEQDPDEKVMAAEEIIAAIESKDAAALAEALQALVSMCSYSEPEEMDEA